MHMYNNYVFSSIRLMCLFYECAPVSEYSDRNSAPPFAGSTISLVDLAKYV